MWNSHKIIEHCRQIAGGDDALHTASFNPYYSGLAVRRAVVMKGINMLNLIKRLFSLRIDKTMSEPGQLIQGTVLPDGEYKAEYKDGDLVITLVEPKSEKA